MANILLEAPVFTVEGALKAAEYGVDRLEICSDFSVGGTTPSAGMISYLKDKLNIPIYVMIRPRGTDFVYTKEEFVVMEKDINSFRKMGVDGFVFGALTPSGAIDMENCRKLINAAEDKPCTFHRAFDVSLDLNTSIDQIISLGFKRILTSGGMNTVTEGMDKLLGLLEIAQNRIIVLPGGGLLPHHIPTLAQTGNLIEVHASCKTFRVSEAKSQNSNLQFSTNTSVANQVLTIDPEQVAEFKDRIRSLPSNY